MKKNLISVGILALIIVNLVLTGIMMFSVINTNKKTAALVSDIATAINLELTDASETGPEVETVAIADISSQTIGEMTIPLRVGEDGKQHYGVLSVTFSLNTKHPDYKELGPNFLTYEDLIKGKINDVVSSYSYEEASANTSAMSDQILAEVQKLFNSDFVFDCSFSSALFN